LPVGSLNIQLCGNLPGNMNGNMKTPQKGHSKYPNYKKYPTNVQFIGHFYFNVGFFAMNQSITVWSFL
jgi:hypothetical protein